MSEKIPKGWKWVKLGDVVIINPNETLKKGIIAKKVPMEALHPFTKKVKFFVFEKYNGGVKFKNGDTLVARITPSLENGKTVYVDFLDDDEIGFGSTEFIVLREKSGITDKQFVYYFAISNDFRDVAIKSMTGSSGRQRVQNEVVKEFEFPLPPLPDQKAIAEVLSSIDDKIDLLHRQNKTLEEMAMTLFRQWFIEPTKDGLPEGWKMGYLADEFDITMGQSPPGETLNEEKIGMVFFQGGSDFRFRFPVPRVYTTAPTRIAKPLDTLVSVRAPVGDINMAFEECCLGRGVAAFRYKQKPEFYSYTYYKMRSLTEQIKLFEDNGTVFGSIGKENFKKLDCFIPPIEMILKFEKNSKPFDDKIISNTKQIQTLEKLRDTLLPKLMSGEVRVKF